MSLTPVSANGTIPDGVVTNAKLADMAEATIKGRQAGAGTGDPQDLTAAQARTAMGLGDAATKTVGAANGVCGLDSGSKIPVANLPSGIDVKVLADATDSTPGYLSEKCDNSTLEVDATAHAMRVKALGIADAHIATAAAIAWTKISKSGAAPGDVGAQASNAELTSLAGLSTVGVVKRTGTATHSILGTNTPGEAGLAGKRTVSVVTTDQTPTVTDSDTLYQNTAAGALVTVTLPSSPTVGTSFTAVVQNANGIKFQCPASTTVWVGTTQSSSAGYTQSTANGSSITLVCIDSTTWAAVAVTGTWTTA